MSFADPSITVSGATIVLPRTGSAQDSGSFRSSDGAREMTVRHTYAKRVRRVIRLNQSKISSDPLVPSQNARSNMAVYMVVDVPQNGYTTAEQKAEVDAFLAFLSASTGAKVTQLLGGEN